MIQALLNSSLNPTSYNVHHHTTKSTRALRVSFTRRKSHPFSPFIYPRLCTFVKQKVAATLDRKHRRSGAVARFSLFTRPAKFIMRAIKRAAWACSSNTSSNWRPCGPPSFFSSLCNYTRCRCCAAAGSEERVFRQPYRRSSNQWRALFSCQGKPEKCGCLGRFTRLGSTEVCWKIYTLLLFSEEILTKLANWVRLIDSVKCVTKWRVVDFN